MRRQEAETVRDGRGAQDVIILAPLVLLALWLISARWLLSGRNGARGDTSHEQQWLEEDRNLGQHVALLGALGVVFALILNLLLSLLVNEPRPFVSHPGVVHVLIPHFIDNSFPSDHEAVIGAVTPALGLYVPFIIKATVSVTQVRRVLRRCSALDC